GLAQSPPRALRSAGSEPDLWRTLSSLVAPGAAAGVQPGACTGPIRIGAGAVVTGGAAPAGDGVDPGGAGAVPGGAGAAAGGKAGRTTARLGGGAWRTAAGLLGARA